MTTQRDIDMKAYNQGFDVGQQHPDGMATHATELCPRAPPSRCLYWDLQWRRSWLYGFSVGQVAGKCDKLLAHLPEVRQEA
jgi:hypothetical protein